VQILILKVVKTLWNECLRDLMQVRKTEEGETISCDCQRANEASPAGSLDQKRIFLWI